ncbi:MAG: nickel-responsive transcriptional regulator NikR [gamma proteobacterium symbiont of Ctena orbiculata]|nr:nickel-responsive transcriptional regulator NikR [Candidatus Thiodiazotropha sp. (ex Lucina pensylvanica)]MBT3064147.1 nickel-responsive transcriptional regulator NikR [Candidatus Thiodiazotropha sp. (ex Lucina pensylvanica)]
MTDNNELARVTISLPEGLLNQLDKRFIDQGYASRSELVRDMIREKLVEERWAGEREEVFGVLTISYDHHQRGLTEKINHTQHHSYINVLCTTHVHLDHNHCLETIIVRGKPNEIEQLATRIGGMRGVRFSKLTRASLPTL